MSIMNILKEWAPQVVGLIFFAGVYWQTSQTMGESQVRLADAQEKLTLAVAALAERVGALETHQSARAEARDNFWAITWPRLEDRIRSVETKIDRHIESHK